MRRLPHAICALALAWPALGPAAARGAGGEASACALAAVAAMQKRYESVRDLRARFEQTTRSVSLSGPGAVSTARGRVVFAKPGRMRWAYEEPEPSLVVSDGEWLWLYDPAHGEAQRYPVGEGFLSAAAIQFLLGEGDLLRDFRVEALACDGNEAHLELVPRRPASYERMRVRADPARGDLRETEVVDLLGNLTRVRFLDVEVDTGPDPGLFRFEAPEGVEIIDVGPPPSAP
jgi:outer membrane lipoprotein carrier protein